MAMSLIHIIYTHICSNSEIANFLLSFFNVFCFSFYCYSVWYLVLKDKDNAAWTKILIAYKTSREEIYQVEGFELLNVTTRCFDVVKIARGPFRRNPWKFSVKIRLMVRMIFIFVFCLSTFMSHYYRTRWQIKESVLYILWAVDV